MAFAGPGPFKMRIVKSRGFSLLEILIAVLILSTGVVVICRNFSMGLFAAREVEGVDLALNIAQAKMENLKNTSFGSLADSGFAADPNFPNYSVAVNVAEGQEPMRIDVTVAWNVKKAQPNLTLTTLRSNY